MIRKDYKGLTSQEVIENRQKYGTNVLTPAERAPWWKLYLEKFGDPIVQILCVAAVASIIIGCIEGQFIEPIGIVVAILIATTIGFINEFQAQKKFDILNKVNDDIPVKVKRDGDIIEVPRKDIVALDLVYLSAGEEVPADCDIIESCGLKVDESCLTGESVPVSKGTSAKSGTYGNIALMKGTVISEGNCSALVTSVGDRTEFGHTARQAAEITDVETPLNKQLNGLGSLINKIAFISAGILIAALLVRYFVIDQAYIGKDILAVVNNCLGFVMIAVALIVVAVPEGLPMAVTLALSYSMKKMIKTNNLVRKMHACETIGAATVILTDKTGTLTQNKMKVVAASGDFRGQLTKVNAVVNSTATINKHGEVIGNVTEGAILKYLDLSSEEIDSIRSNCTIVHREPFDSEKKYMLTVIKNGDSFLTFVKGAPELLFQNMSSSEQSDFAEQITRGRRSLAFSYKKSDSFEEACKFSKLSDQALYFIEDPIREDVPEAIAECYKAGIEVVMMTGDNIQTATEIARQAGFKDIWAVEAKDWSNVAFGDPDCGMPNVVARCKPMDKLNIEKELIRLGYVCAMTGDGTNDAPALNYAQVGLAMGNGTAVAKEASDIILLDNSFPSIISAVRWGRSLYKNIQHFILFQLTINVVAILIALVGPFIGINLPFTVTQMLWVNLIMDTFAALALATEPANEAVMSEKPRDPKAFIITENMYINIGLMGLSFFAILLYMLINDIVSLTEFFTFFVMLQWWNLFNARVFDQDRSIFNGLTKNPAFIGITLVILIGQILIVQFGGEMFRTEPLSLSQWTWIIGLTSSVVIVREFTHYLRTL